MPNEKNYINEQIIFEQGKDPGEGLLRVLGDFDKLQGLEKDRNITFREIYQIVFGKGRSTLLKEQFVLKENEGIEVQERQFKIIGLTAAGRPLLVVTNPRGVGGLIKRIVTAWQVSRDSNEVKQLIGEYPELANELKNQ